MGKSDSDTAWDWRHKACSYSILVLVALSPLLIILPLSYSECAWALTLTFLGMSIASVCLTVGFVRLMHRWLRSMYLCGGNHPGHGSYEGRAILRTTIPWDWTGFALGVVERSVFIAITVLLLNETYRFSGSASVLAGLAIGWVGAKAASGWRRYQSTDPAILRGSMVGLSGSMLSVFLGVMTGVVLVVVNSFYS